MNKPRNGYWLRHDDNGTEIFLSANKRIAGKIYNNSPIPKGSYVMESFGVDVETKNNAWAAFEISPADLI